MTSTTTVSQLKSTFIEAIQSSLEELKDSEGLEDDPTTSTIKLFKQSEDEQGIEKWIPLDDSTNVDKAGLDQGHVVGVSFKRDGKRILLPQMLPSRRKGSSSSCCEHPLTFRLFCNLIGDFTDPEIASAELPENGTEEES